MIKTEFQIFIAMFSSSGSVAFIRVAPGSVTHKCLRNAVGSDRRHGIATIPTDTLSFRRIPVPVQKKQGCGVGSFWVEQESDS